MRMFKSKGQYFLIGILFLATNLLYYFAQRDTVALEQRAIAPTESAQLSPTDTTQLPIRH